MHHEKANELINKKIAAKASYDNSRTILENNRKAFKEARKVYKKAVKSKATREERVAAYKKMTTSKKMERQSLKEFGNASKQLVRQNIASRKKRDPPKELPYGWKLSGVKSGKYDRTRPGGLTADDITCKGVGKQGEPTNCVSTKASEAAKKRFEEKRKAVAKIEKEKREPKTDNEKKAVAFVAGFNNNQGRILEFKKAAQSRKDRRASKFKTRKDRLTASRQRAHQRVKENKEKNTHLNEEFDIDVGKNDGIGAVDDSIPYVDPAHQKGLVRFYIYSYKDGLKEIEHDQTTGRSDETTLEQLIGTVSSTAEELREKIEYGEEIYGDVFIFHGDLPSDFHPDQTGWRHVGKKSRDRISATNSYTGPKGLTTSNIKLKDGVGDFTMHVVFIEEEEDAE